MFNRGLVFERNINFRTLTDTVVCLSKMYEWCMKTIEIALVTPETLIFEFAWKP